MQSLSSSPFSMPSIVPSLSPLSVALFLLRAAPTTIFLYLLFFLLRNAVNLFHLRHIPTPSSFRDAYSLVTILFYSDHGEIASLFNNIFHEHGSSSPLVRLSGFLGVTNIFALSTASVRQLTSLPTSFPKSSSLVRFLQSFTGPSSIFTSAGAEHRRLRAMITPPLRHDFIVNHLQRVFFREARALGPEFEKGGGDDVIKVVRKGAFRVVMHACFGLDFIRESEIDSISALYHTALLPNPVLVIARRLFLPTWFPTSWISEANAAREKLRKLVYALCERVLMESQSESKRENDHGEIPSNSLLGQMIATQNSPQQQRHQSSSSSDGGSGNEKHSKAVSVSADEMVGTVLSFLLAGQATTTLSISWVLYILAENPDIQQSLYDSLYQSQPQSQSQSGHEYDIEALDRNKLLDGVVRETLRLYPPLNYIVRTVSTADGGAKLDGVFVPNGTTVRVPVLALQTRAEIWGEDALEFRPERWWDEKNRREQKWAMCVFWHGSHGCVGQRFAHLEIKAFTAEILREFEIRHVGDGNGEEGRATLKRRGLGTTVRGLQLRLVRRAAMSET